VRQGSSATVANSMELTASSAYIVFYAWSHLALSASMAAWNSSLPAAAAAKVAVPKKHRKTAALARLIDISPTRLPLTFVRAS
jgi:hypothetical protein